MLVGGGGGAQRTGLHSVSMPVSLSLRDKSHTCQLTFIPCARIHRGPRSCACCLHCLSRRSFQGEIQGSINKNRLRMKIYLLIATIYLSRCSALYFHMGETEKKCFLEEIPDETMVTGEQRNRPYIRQLVCGPGPSFALG